MLCLLIDLVCALCGVEKYPIENHSVEYYVNQESISSEWCKCSIVFDFIMEVSKIIIYLYLIL